jgi:LmbE family N-acetylglucosaminyl deacetylase
MQNIQTLLNNTKNKKLLVVFPHPDDESVMSAGLIQAAIAQGWRVRVISLTHGEAGKMHINGKGKSLKEIRKLEFEQAMKHLQVADSHVHHFPDGNLKQTKLSWRNMLKTEIASFKPGIMVTYDSTGITGHPDHVVLSYEISLLVNELNNDTTKNAPHLLWPAYEGLPKKRMYHPELFNSAPEPSHRLVLNPTQVLKKYQAIKAHKSQRVGKSQPMPLWLVMVLFGRNEYYTLAKSAKPNKPKFIEFVI